MKSVSYWVIKVERGELKKADLVPVKDFSLLKTIVTGVSTGTEKLVGKGLVTKVSHKFMSVPYMEGSFQFPIKYGYSLVGEPLSGRYKGTRVFLMHPHQNSCFVSDKDLHALPDTVTSKAAILIPNMETALNAVWDAELKQDEKIAIVGAGIIGILTGFVLTSMGFKYVLIEKNYACLKESEELSWTPSKSLTRSKSGKNYDVIFHTTGSPDGLQTSIDLGGFEGRVIDLSWYGAKKVTLNLGDSFHWNRKKIIASQVSHVASIVREEKNKADRFNEVLDLLKDPALNELKRSEVEFTNLPRLMNDLYKNKYIGWAPIITY